MRRHRAHLHVCGPTTALHLHLHHLHLLHLLPTHSWIPTFFPASAAVIDAALRGQTTATREQDATATLDAGQKQAEEKSDSLAELPDRVTFFADSWEIIRLRNLLGIRP